MLNRTVRVLFYLKKPKGYVRGPIPIYLRITIDGRRWEQSTRRVCEDPSKWNPGAGRVVGNKESIRSLNAYLDQLQYEAYEKHRQLVAGGSPISYDTIKQGLIGKRARQRMLMEVFELHNQQVQALTTTDLAPLTAKRYRTVARHTSEFLHWKYHKADVPLTDLNYEFISEFEFFFKTIRKCNHNSTMKYLSNFKKVVLDCLKKGWLDKDPFVGYKMTTREVLREFLTQDELNKIAAHQFQTERLNLTRDIFLFSCYTGLAYVDVLHLHKSDIRVGVDGKEWIFSTRHKTDTPFHVPLLPVPLQIAKKYADHSQCICTGRLLPVWSNQKLNEYLKDIAQLCGIPKLLTYHMARHTFATTVTLNNGVPIDSVSKMLGHKNLKITQRYARTLDRKISADMDLLHAKYLE